MIEKLKLYLSYTDDQLAALKINNNPKELYDPIKYTLSLGGKRIRPLLVLMACEAFGGRKEDAISAALGIEVFHNFTLLHDDIMDNAPLRRNQETVHRKWNPNIAILSGDTMFVIAQQLMLNIPNHALKPCLELFNKTAIEVCEGQQMDMNFEQLDFVSIPTYINMISLKTSVLLAAALKIGALIANASDEDANHIYNYGKNLGIAFQLQDDILDVYANPDKFGKQVGGDIISNKKTFLLLKALELSKLNPYKKDELNQWLQVPLEYAKDKVQAVKEIYNFLGVKQIAEKEVQKYYELALSSIKKLSISPENQTIFIDFARYIMQREF